MSCQQSAVALTEILAHATAGPLITDRETLLPTLVAEAWFQGSRSRAGGPS
jgi:hypothetical protein